MHHTTGANSVTMSPKTSSLSKPVAGKRIPLGTLGYFQLRNKQRVYELVIREFLRERLTQAELARRLGKGPDQISRMLGAPGNWTLDTVSDLLFAISGAEPEYGIGYPLDGAPRNDVVPEWLNRHAETRAPRFEAEAPEGVAPSGSTAALGVKMHVLEPFEHA